MDNDWRKHIIPNLKTYQNLIKLTILELLSPMSRDVFRWLQQVRSVGLLRLYPRTFLQVLYSYAHIFKYSTFVNVTVCAALSVKFDAVSLVSTGFVF